MWNLARKTGGSLSLRAASKKLRQSKEKHKSVVTRFGKFAKMKSRRALVSLKSGRVAGIGGLAMALRRSPRAKGVVPAAPATAVPGISGSIMGKLKARKSALGGGLPPIQGRASRLPPVSLGAGPVAPVSPARSGLWGKLKATSASAASSGDASPSTSAPSPSPKRGLWGRLKAGKSARVATAALGATAAAQSPKQRGSLWKSSALRKANWKQQRPATLKDLMGKSKLKRAARLIKLTKRLDTRVDHTRSDDGLNVWFELHRRNTPEAALLRKGDAVCSCIHPFPDTEYVPEHLCSRGQIHWRLFESRNRFVVASFTVLMFLYLPVSTRILNYFLCEEIGSTFRVVMARGNECFTDKWWSIFPLAMGGLLLFVIALPLCMVAMLNRKRRAHVDTYLTFLKNVLGKPVLEDEAPKPGCCARRCARLYEWFRYKTYDWWEWCRRWRQRETKQERELRELHQWLWDKARKELGATEEQAKVGGTMHAAVQESFNGQNHREFNKAIALAREDERALGNLPTSDEVELVRKFMYVWCASAPPPRAVTLAC